MLSERVPDDSIKAGNNGAMPETRPLPNTGILETISPFWAGGALAGGGYDPKRSNHFNKGQKGDAV
jgi:hypothetical protein